MSKQATVFFVKDTGHVLAAVTRADEPSGDDRAAADEVLTRNGVLVRSVTPEQAPPASPAAPPVRDQGRVTDALTPISVPLEYFRGLKPPLTYEVTETAGTPLNWLKFDPATGLLEFDPTVDPGTLPEKTNVLVTAKDAKQILRKVQFKLNISKPDSLPIVLNPISRGVAWIGTYYTLRVPSDTFLCGTTPKYTFKTTNRKEPPEWLLFDAQKCAFAGTPGVTDVGPLEITVTATDGADKSVEATFTVDVRSPASVEFTIEADQLSTHHGEAPSEIILGQPRRFRVVGEKDQKKIEPLPEQGSLPELTYELIVNGLRVSLAAPATANVSLWAQVKKAGTQTVAKASIPVGQQSATIGFLFDRNASVDVLLLAEGYAPISAENLHTL